MSEGSKGLRLTNTLTRSKEDFSPIDPDNVRMYVCGPTVYDFAHIGNARPVIVFDVLFRLLRHLYGADHVTYVRNITDVDDKINARALRDFGDEISSGKLSLNDAIRRVTEKTADQFHKDVAALGCLEPTFEPRATEFVQPRADGKADMVTLIQSLIQRGHAYVAEGEVLFDTSSMADYGQLSKRNLDEQQAGARIAVDTHKKNPQDFVLWKLSSPDEPGWDSPWGRGRPGWHIECSAMSAAYLGDVFDVHGGGLDLIFPHHENEIAQSRCAHGTHAMANVWMHNGFLQVEGQKMSKSLGNFYSINELLETENFGGRPWHAAVVRYAMLTTHYREPIDWSVGNLTKARRELFLFVDALRHFSGQPEPINGSLDEEFLAHLRNDLDTPSALARLAQLRQKAVSDSSIAEKIALALEWIGIVKPNDYELFDEGYLFDLEVKIPDNIGVIVEKYRVATANNSINVGKSVSDELGKLNIRLVDIKPGLVSLTQVGKTLTNNDFDNQVENQKNRRLAFIAAKNWAEADRIRDELLTKGIQLKDGKDPATGERITTWEVKR